MFKGKITKLLSLVVVGALLVGCGAGAGNTNTGSTNAGGGSVSESETLNPEGSVEEGASFKSVVQIAVPNDIPSNAPYGNSNVQTSILTNSTFNRLVSIDEDYNIVPDLATSWDVNEDSTEWTFHLRDDVTFHNGEPFVADDVKFTFEYASSNENEGITFAHLAGEFIDEIVVVDPTTVVFNLNQSIADFGFYAAQKIMSQATIERDGIADGGSIGTGPFVFGSHQEGIQWNMTRNENYHGELPVTEEIIFRVVTDGNTRSLALESGDVDAIFDPSTTDIRNFVNNPDRFNVFRGNNSSNIFLGLNQARPASQDVNVRQAIAMAVNRDDIVAAVFEGGEVGIPSDNFINDVSPGYAEVDAYAFDPEAATALMAESGYDASNHLPMTLYTFARFIPVAEIIQANLAQINIDLTIQEWSASGFSGNIREDGGYDMYIQQTSTIGGVLSIVQRFLLTGGASNLVNYSSTELDTLFQEAMSSPNMDDLYATYAEMQQVIATDVPVVPLVQQFLWAVGSSDFFGAYLGNQNYDVDFTNSFVVEN